MSQGPDKIHNTFNIYPPSLPFSNGRKLKTKSQEISSFLSKSLYWKYSGSDQKPSACQSLMSISPPLHSRCSELYSQNP